MERLEVLGARVASTWTLETAAALLSAGSLAALVGVLMAANGQPVLDWQWHNVTLNAVVSVLSTVSRITALYVLSAAIGQTKWILFSRGPASLLDFEAIDLASRGFGGCVRILFTAKRIVFVGALAVLVALAFDPFAQQLVQLHSEVTYASSKNTAMPVARRYDAGSLTFTSNQHTKSGLMPISANADFGMQAAVLNGLTQDKAVIDGQMPLQCRSGNCTWEGVQSLAVCSTCNDVTSALRRWKTDSPAIQYLSTLNYATFIANATTYGLGHQVFLNNVDGSIMRYTDAVMMATYGTGDSAQTNSLKDIDTLVWATGMIKAAANTAVNATWPRDFTVSATECALYYCVREYNITMTENRVSESSTELTSAKRVRGSWQYLDASARRHSWNESFAQTLTYPGSRPGWATSVDLTAERSDLELGSDYNISQSSVLSLSLYMNNTFTRAATQPYNASYPDNPYILGGYYIRNSLGSGTTYQPDVMQALYNSDSMSGTFERLAASMSNAMRAHQSSNTSASGNLGELVASYRIVWPWIGLPAFVVIASIVQLSITLLANKKSPVWKSSTLATLSRGHCVQDLLVGATTVRDFRVAAGERDVYLFDDRSGQHMGGGGGGGYEKVPKPPAATTAVEEDGSDESLLRR